MNKMTIMTKEKTEGVTNGTQRKTRRKFSASEKSAIVLRVLKGEDSIAEICRKEGIAPPLYYRWSKDFVEAGERRLQGDVEPTSNDSVVSGLREENSELKEALAEEILRARGLEKKYSEIR